MDSGRKRSPKVTPSVSRRAGSIVRSVGNYLRGTVSHAWAHAHESVRPRAAVIHVFANRTNIGDWLSALGIQALLAPVAVREVYCDRRFLGTTTAVLEQASPRDFVIIGGGGLLHDHFTPFWEAFSECAQRVPHVVWGVGCCWGKGGNATVPLPVLAQALRAAEMIVVRDQETADHLASIGLQSRVAPCPSCIVLDRPWPDGRAVLYARHPGLLDATASDAIAAVLQNHAEAECRDYQETTNTIPEGRHICLLRALRDYVLSDLVVSSRLHGCIIGSAMGRRLIAISADHKIDAFMATLGLSDQVVSPEAVPYLREVIERQVIARPAKSHLRQACELNESVAVEIWPRVWSCIDHALYNRGHHVKGAGLT